MGLILDQIVEGMCVTVLEPLKWPFGSAGIPSSSSFKQKTGCEWVIFIFIMLMPLFCLLFLYNHSFIVFSSFIYSFIFTIFFPYDLSWRSRRELYCLIEWVARFHRVNILFIDVFLLLLFFLIIHSLMSFLFVFYPPFCAWELCLQSKSWTCLWSKIFSTFLMLPL